MNSPEHSHPALSLRSAFLLAAAVMALMLTHYWTYSVGFEFGYELARDEWIERNGGDR